MPTSYNRHNTDRALTGGFGLRTEEAGLGSGGRGKSEIFPALQKCSDRYYTKKVFAKRSFFLLISFKRLLAPGDMI